MTFWQIGEKVAHRWVPEMVGEIIAIEESAKPYNQAGMKVKPKFPVEWCKIRFTDGQVKEYAGHELLSIKEEVRQ